MLKLERDNITFFPMQWTVVHPIDKGSPLYRCTEQELRETGAEFIILLSGIEETFSQQVHSRTSSRAEEIVYGARFRDMYVQQDGEALRADVRLLSAYEPAELPAEPAQPA
jgi:inward rectifier potassium channel